MKVPKTGKIVVNDLVRGQVEFDLSTIDDQIILKSDGFPTYHLAHVVDDAEMGITHVIRAEEWLPSTPKHILLNQMLGYKIPQYAHLPVILGPNRGKLSKRDGATGIMEYKKLGYLPEALINFMVLLGWNPKTNEEFFTLDELEKKFDIKQVNHAAAIFDIQKLNHFNRHYIQKKPASELIALLDPKIVSKLRRQSLEKAVELAQQRMTTLNDFGETISYLISEPKIDHQKLVFKKSTAANTKKALEIAAATLKEITKWEKSEILTTLQKIVSQNELSNGDVFWSVRFALSGLEKSPPPEEIAEVLGKEETIKRIKIALSKL
jgi:glutamyl-tRNA synthetase